MEFRANLRQPQKKPPAAGGIGGIKPEGRLNSMPLAAYTQVME